LIIRIQVIIQPVQGIFIDKKRVCRNASEHCSNVDFGFNLRMPDLSQPEEVRDLFREILISADDQTPIRGLERSSFSYGISEDGIAQISGFLHVINKEGKLTEDAVRTWIINDRIMGDIEWTPIRPGNHGDCRQHSLIRSVLAARDGCDGGTESGPRRLEDWVGKSSDKIDSGGRPRQESADRGPAENGGSESDP
jgi:hypothetical protein